MMVGKFVKRLVIGAAALAASAYSASAQYDSPAGAVVGAQVSQQVSAQVSSTVSSGAASAAAGAVGGSVAPTVNSSELPTTKYFEGGNRGRSAGAKDKKIGAWVLGSYSDIENDFVNTKFDGDIAAFVGGADYRLTDKIIAGLAVSYEDVDIDTTFNNGTIETKGFGVTPYAVFVLSNKLTADISGSYTWLNTDTTRTNGAVTGEFDARRYTAGANLNYSHSINKFFMTGTVGFLYINEKQDSYTESNGTFVDENNISIGQGRIGAKVGYDFGKFKPFVMARYEHEFWAPSAPQLGGGLLSPEEDNDGYVVGAGVDFSISDSVSGGIQATSTEGREDLNLYSISGRVRVLF
jgi:outer membrane autotransporter protein